MGLSAYAMFNCGLIAVIHVTRLLFCELCVMPQCPRCEKRFKSEARLLRHMNQPRASCVNFVDDLIPVAYAFNKQDIKLDSVRAATIQMTWTDTHNHNHVSESDCATDPYQMPVDSLETQSFGEGNSIGHECVSFLAIRLRSLPRPSQTWRGRQSKRK